MEEGEEKKVPQEEEKENDPVLCQAYASLPKVRVTFRTEGVGIANSSKY